MGYECRYGLLNSVHYGTPQMRERCFLIGITRLAHVEPGLPAPTHRWELPRGYKGTRDVALRTIDLFQHRHFMTAPSPKGTLPNAVTAEQALCDLPPITEHLCGQMKKGPRRFETPLKLVEAFPPNNYIRLMKTWPRFESDGYVYDHVIRFLPRDYAIFERMRPGDQYPEAHKVALAMRDEVVTRLEMEYNQPISRQSREFKALTARYVPPYDPGKFPNKWRKMEADAPTRTIMAHIGKDTYSVVRYRGKDIEQSADLTSCYERPYPHRTAANL